jgi:acyl carrier protein
MTHHADSPTGLAGPRSKGPAVLTVSTVKDRLAGLIATASEGSVTSEQVLAAQHQITALGLPSVVQLRAIDAIENEFGVDLDLDRDDTSYLDSLDGLVGYLADEGIAVSD